MSQVISGSLLSTPAPTSLVEGITFIILFLAVGTMVGADYEGMNEHAVKS
tara:strand:- start:291 stop:440 length:150 start_codon:yes stop_codon:yes gene_type:complete